MESETNISMMAQNFLERSVHKLNISIFQTPSNAFGLNMVMGFKFMVPNYALNSKPSLTYTSFKKHVTNLMSLKPRMVLKNETTLALGVERNMNII